MEEKKNQALNDAVENEENVAVAAQSAPASDDLCLTDEEKGKLLVVRHLKKYFPLKTDFFGRPLTYVRAVDDVSFTVDAGKTIGIVGESGCGKTTMGRTILRLHSVTDGQVIFDGKDISKLKPKELRAMRPQIQMIFQDPYSSLSPRMPVGEIIGEAVRQHNIVPREQYRQHILDTMKKCGLQTHYFERYPHEFSGGQRQRIGIARALSINPKFIVCDEPVSALDVSVQAQVINLLLELQRNMGLTYLFIAHDLSVVKHISDNVAVMYLGTIVELASSHELYGKPQHPYTQALLSAIPLPDPDVTRAKKRILLEGDVPSPIDIVSGCKFASRCKYATERCRGEMPELREVRPGHYVACHML